MQHRFSCGEKIPIGKDYLNHASEIFETPWEAIISHFFDNPALSTRIPDFDISIFIMRATNDCGKTTNGNHISITMILDSVFSLNPLLQLIRE